MSQVVSDVTEVLDYKKAKKEAKSQRQELLAQMARDEQSKTNLVKKALAAQRAKYGASGMSGTGMTEKAVLKRLKSETEEPYEEKRKNNLTKLKSLKVSKPNLLQSFLKRFDQIFD